MVNHGKLGTREGEGAPGDTPAEQALARELGGGEASGAGKPGGRRSYSASDDFAARDVREREALARLAPQFPIEPTPRRVLGKGAEHVVELTLDCTRVLKFTKPGSYGYAIHPYVTHFGHFVEIYSATPRDYLERMRLHSEIFGTDTRIEGLSVKAGSTAAPSIVSSQSYLRGSKPSAAEVEEKMRKIGFLRVHPDFVANPYLEKTTWYDAGRKILVTDAKPANFVKTESGEIVPIDLIVSHITSQTEMVRSMEEGVRRAGRAIP